jgi:hypothetical protein
MLGRTLQVLKHVLLQLRHVLMAWQPSWMMQSAGQL